mmetsp:Transcript_87300/g.154714  ORF Transcript_87300/g.154714 Transcript_87300/m.154714 type:complete len:220 (+) Transcript_87300:1676-2335(+)
MHWPHEWWHSWHGCGVKNRERCWRSRRTPQVWRWWCLWLLGRARPFSVRPRPLSIWHCLRHWSNWKLKRSFPLLVLLSLCLGLWRTFARRLPSFSSLAVLLTLAFAALAFPILSSFVAFQGFRHPSSDDGFRLWLWLWLFLLIGLCASSSPTTPLIVTLLGCSLWGSCSLVLLAFALPVTPGIVTVLVCGLGSLFGSISFRSFAFFGLRPVTNSTFQLQ